MKGKVQCTCGWSWNKSDSSKKDMYICHECGKDNSNNMKNGGWLDNYNDSQASAPEGFQGDGYSNVGRNYSPAWGGQFQNGGKKKPITTREDFEPSVLSNIPGLTSLASGNQPGYNRQERYGPLGDLYKYYGGQPLEHDILVESQNKPSTSKDKNAKYVSLNHDREFVNEVLDNYERVSSGKLDKGIESKLNDNSWSVSGYSSAGKNAHKTKKQGSEHHSNAIGRYTLGKGKDEKGEYISYYDKFDQGTGSGMNPGEALGLTKPFEIYDRIYLKDVNRKFQMGGSVYPVNYVPQAQNGKLTFLQPTSDKLPEGYMKGSSIPSTERAMSIGGENGEPAYLIPSFKYGQELLGPVFDPISEFRRTGEHLGGPFKTWQEADKWEIENRHPAVEKGEKIMFPQEKFAMGGSIPGAVGFTYARTQGAAPSNGKYAKKTMASAQTGVKLDMYGAPITAIEVNDPSASRTSYDPRTNRMILGSDTNAENRDKAIAHENYHASKYLDNMMNYDIAHHTDNEQWARMQARPSMVSTDNVWSSYYDRKPREINDLINNDINSSEFLKSYANTVSQGSPSIASGLVGDTVYDRVNVDKQLYETPGTSEGEAQRYEDTGIRSYEEGGIIKDDMGQWNHPGEITEIGSNDITMEGVPYDVLGISDTGDTKLMKPGKNYKFKGKKVTEYPMAKNGIRQEQKGLQNLDNLINFTNYNKPQPGGWLNKYN